MTPPVKAKDADVYLLTAQTFNEFPDLVTTDGSFKELRKVSDANPQKANLLWGTSEVVQFKNADGVPLTGALYKPENFDPTKKYPMMVYIYERLTQNVNHFVDPRPSHNINLSYYASNGYLVFTPDIVYTTGYPGPERAEVRAARRAGDRGQGLREGRCHRHSGPQLGRLPDRLHGDADQSLPRRGRGRAGGQHDQRLRRHPLGHRASRASSSTSARRAASADRSGNIPRASSRTRPSSGRTACRRR